MSALLRIYGSSRPAAPVLVSTCATAEAPRLWRVRSETVISGPESRQWLYSRYQGVAVAGGMTRRPAIPSALAAGVAEPSSNSPGGALPESRRTIQHRHAGAADLDGPACHPHQLRPLITPERCSRIARTRACATAHRVVSLAQRPTSATPQVPPKASPAAPRQPSSSVLRPSPP